MNDVSFINETNEELEEIKTLEKLIEYAIKFKKIDNVIFSIIFIEDDKMHELNMNYRNIDRTTDVLSFAFEDNNDIKNQKVRLLGEIYISINKAKAQALEYSHSYLRELSFLMIHGFLHLLGYDHQNEKDEKEMFQCQEEILNGYGIKR